MRDIKALKSDEFQVKYSTILINNVILKYI